MEYRKLQQLGNSLVVSLLPSFLARHGLRKGDYVVLREEDGRLIIEPAPRRDVP